LVREELAAGLLVAPFDIFVSDDTGYFTVCRRGRLAEPAIVAFCDWLASEAEADEQNFAPRDRPQMSPSLLTTG
jgi:DNA-binding transcriptional LysR family regulator